MSKPSVEELGLELSPPIYQCLQQGALASSGHPDSSLHHFSPHHSGWWSPACWLKTSSPILNILLTSTKRLLSVAQVNLSLGFVTCFWLMQRTRGFKSSQASHCYKTRGNTGAGKMGWKGGTSDFLSSFCSTRTLLGTFLTWTHLMLR